jgi:hypothetical protein
MTADAPLRNSAVVLRGSRLHLFEIDFHDLGMRLANVHLRIVPRLRIAVP